MSDVNAFVPPLAVSRVICQWHFEGGGFVAIVSDGTKSTSEMLDAIQTQIDLKRKELGRKIEL